jgi:hypothetical protein
VRRNAAVCRQRDVQESNGEAARLDPGGIDVSAHGLLESRSRKALERHLLAGLHHVDALELDRVEAVVLYQQLQQRVAQLIAGHHRSRRRERAGREQ